MIWRLAARSQHCGGVILSAKAPGTSPEAPLPFHEARV